MSKNTNNKLTIFAVVGLICLIPGLIFGCGNKNEETDLVYSKGIKVATGQSLTTLKVGEKKLRDENGNYYLFLKDAEGKTLDLHKGGIYQVTNPTITPKKDTESYFLRAKIKYYGVTDNSATEIEDIDDYFRAVPEFSKNWLLSPDGYYYNVKDGVLEWNNTNKCHQLKLNSKGNAGFAMFGSDKCSYVISENASLEYDYVGARVVIEAVNGDTTSDEILKEKGWTFKSNLVSGVKITYNLCGGSVLKPIEDISATEKDKLKITNIVPVRRGYTFKEWNTSIDGFGVRFVSGDTFVVGKYNTTLYAIWEPKTYSITLDKNGGEYRTGDVIPSSYTYGVATDLPEVRKEGYVFEGWYDSQNVKYDYITKTTDGDLKLTAKWNVKNYTITYKTFGGTINSGLGESYNIEQGAILPTDVTKTGYVFEGWYDSYKPTTDTPEVWGNKVEEVLSTEKGNKIFYAKWSIKKLTVTLDANRGTIGEGNISGETKPYGTALPTDVTRTGYEFIGWFTELSGGERVETVGDGDGSVTYYARWQAKEYSITFNYNGGSVHEGEEKETEKVTFGQAVGALPAPEKLGYSFDGWWANASFEGEEITATSIWSIAGDTTLFAKWIGNNDTAYKIEYYFENLQGEFEHIENRDETKYGVTGTSVSVELKSIDGFSRVSNANEVLTGDILPDGSLVLKIYYARRTYAITLNKNGGAISSGEEKTEYKFGEEITLPILEKEGYTFEGWFDNEECSGNKIEKISSTDFGDKTFFAAFKQSKFNVVLNKNGGELADGEPDLGEYEFGTETALPILTKVGHTFGGWFASSDFNGETITSIKADETGDKEYFAKWTANSYSLTLNADGGIVRSGEVGSYTFGQGVDLPKDVVRKGYKFGGWRNENTSEIVTSIGATDVGNMSFVANWEDATISFKTSSKDAIDITSVSLPADYTHSSHFETLTVPEISGFVSDGKNVAVRFVKVNGADVATAMNTEIDVYGDITLEYVFDYITKLEIAELKNGDKIIIEGQTAERWGKDASLSFNLPTAKQDVDGKYLVWSDGAKESVCACHYTMDTFGIKVILTPMLKDIVEFDISGNYLVSYNDDGTTNISSNSEITVSRVSVVKMNENEYAVPKATQQGFVFMGIIKNYSEGMTLDNLIAPCQKFTIEGSDTLVGIWREKTYKVEVLLDGGEITCGGINIFFEEVKTDEYFAKFSGNGNGEYILARKEVGGEIYQLEGFEIVSPVKYEELGYVVLLKPAEILIMRQDSDGNPVPLEHSLCLKAVWSKDVSNQKITFKVKDGDKVYLDGQEITELSYDATAYTSIAEAGLSSLKTLNISASKNEEGNFDYSFIFRNSLGNLVTEEERPQWNEGLTYVKVAGGITAELVWTPHYDLKILKGEIEGVEIEDKDIRIGYNQYNYYEMNTDKFKEYLTDFYNVEGYVCIGFDVNCDINYSENWGNVFATPIWKKFGKNGINPGSVTLNEGTENEQTISAIQKSSPIYGWTAESPVVDFSVENIIKNFEFTEDKNYVIKDIKVGGRLLSLTNFQWGEITYQLSGDETNGQYILHDIVKKTENGIEVKTIYKLVTVTGGVEEEEELIIEKLVSEESGSEESGGLSALKKTNGGVVAYVQYGEVYTALQEDGMNVKQETKINGRNTIAEQEIEIVWGKFFEEDGLTLLGSEESDKVYALVETEIANLLNKEEVYANKKLMVTDVNDYFTIDEFVEAMGATLYGPSKFIKLLKSGFPTAREITYRAYKADEAFSNKSYVIVYNIDGLDRAAISFEIDTDSKLSTDYMRRYTIDIYDENYGETIWGYFTNGDV